MRGFASYRLGADPATEVPPCGLVRGHARRARPYLYSDEEVRRLIDEHLDRLGQHVTAALASQSDEDSRVVLAGVDRELLVHRRKLAEL